MKKFVILFIFLISISCFVNLLFAQEANKNKANDVILSFRKNIEKKSKLSDLNSFSISLNKKSSFIFDNKNFGGDESIEMSFNFFDKIRQTSIQNRFIDNKVTNSVNDEYVLNGELISTKIDVFNTNGEKINADLGIIDTVELKKTLKRNAFLTLFPITLDSSWYLPLEFSYVGIAESKDGKANVIEAVSKSGTKYRLFFDSNTNLLLMMIVSWQNKDKLFEKKYFYSEYKEMDGLLIASKRVVEQDKKVIEETLIKTFKVNPKFKDNFFDVKK